ncbi:M15 family metallopeptidase [Terrabacter sp. 2RAF25]|uniref:M15 family metallopeptidase n=1 Tax=Terrabacter sp. 2RAF25 TaxID=3232998 RepID=UPI003F9B428F
MSAPTTTGPTLLSDPRVRGIPVVDDGSRLVDVADAGVRVATAPPEPPPNLGLVWATPTPTPTSTPAPAHRLVRRTLVERLGEAQSTLPDGLHLHVVEGLRPLPAQQAIHTAYRRRLADSQPWLGPDELDRLTSRFVAPPANAPHVSGAAADLTLVDDDGRSLDLGTPIDATPEESRGACYFDAPDIGRQARELRSVLAWALGRAGLVNYPTEWWHWSFGDRYRAHLTGAPFAIHGPVDPSPAFGA